MAVKRLAAKTRTGLTIVVCRLLLFIVRRLTADFIGIHYSFASAQENKNFTQYPLDWTYDFTKAYLHGMPPSREYMYCFPEVSRSDFQDTCLC